jgi:hypothetical protein
MSESQSLSKSLPSRDLLEDAVKRLLNKAGTDPRVTPRLLREKAEQRLKLVKETLKPMREDIKDMIMTWHKERMDKLGVEIKLLVKLTKAAGFGPSLYIDIRELDDREEQKRLLSDRYIYWIACFVAVRRRMLTVIVFCSVLMCF